MRFGSFALDDAVGAILAHTTRVASGVLKKGRVLTEADVAQIRATGAADVVAARIDLDDVGEDDAAHRIACLVGGSGTRVDEPFTGRANIFADRAGVAVLDPAAITRLNAIDERITLATVADYERVIAGQMIATVKIIPFAVPAAVVGRVDAEVATGIVRVAPFVPHRAGLILTRFDATKRMVLARRRDAVAQRLAPLGSVLTETVEVAHTAAAVRDAIVRLAAQNLSPILIFATSAIVDRADVVPSGLVAAGGEIIRLGMPVDPGNLLLLGRLGETPVIGLPSCAASLKLNGFDWVLERTLAHLPVSARDIAAMSQGGLLKEIESRPQPRQGPNLSQATAPKPSAAGFRAPQVAAVVLAAGRSTRMSDQSFKLLAEVDGRPMIRGVVETALASGARPVLVVVGHRAADIGAALAGLDVRLVHNPDYADGLSTSLRIGIGAVPAEADGVVVMLGDMPEVGSTLIDRLIDAFSKGEGHGIVVPVSEGKRGNPVLWARAFFAKMVTMKGDVGAKPLLARHAASVVEIAADASVHADIDTLEALVTLQRRGRRSP